MKRTGFTLIELLAVITILSIVMFIAIPIYTSILAGAREDAFHLDESMAVRGARNYVVTEFVQLPEVSLTEEKSTLEVAYADLVNNHYIKPIYDPKNGAECTGDGVENSSIIITRQNEYKYTYEPNIICPNYRSGDSTYEPATVTYSEDIEAPTLTVLGSNPYYLIVDDTYIEYGAAASDDQDSGVWLSANIQITYGVDTSTAGSYTVCYDVTDSSRKAATQVCRDVVVSDPQIKFGSNNLSDSETFEIWYQPDNVESVFIEVNGLNYYLYGTDAGSSNTKVGRTCNEIYEAYVAAGSTPADGIYWIAPSGTPNDVYCKMSDNRKMLFANFGSSDAYGAAITASDISTEAKLVAAGGYKIYYGNGSCTDGPYVSASGYSYRHICDLAYASNSGLGIQLPTYIDHVDAYFGADTLVYFYCPESKGATSTLGGHWTGAVPVGTIISVGTNTQYRTAGFNEIWVWETTDNLNYSTYSSVFDETEYTFNNFVVGSNTYRAKVVKNENGKVNTYTTDEFTVLK